MTHDVFISYASPDAATAVAVCEAVEADGRSCWMAPRDVEPGARYAEQIVEAIRAARVLVLVFSRAANDSEHVERELDCAVSAGLRIFALRIEEVEPSGALQYYLAGRQWCDAFPRPLEPHLEQVRGAVADLLASKQAGPPPARARARKRSSLLLAAVAVLGAAVVAALAVWALMPSKAPVRAGASVPHATVLTASQIADKYGTSVVDVTAKVPYVVHHKVKWKSVTKPGVVASRDGLIFTNGFPYANTGLGWYAHVATIGLYGSEGQYRTVQARRLDLGDTYAIFKVLPQKAQLYPIPQGDPTSLAKGDPVVVLGRSPSGTWVLDASIDAIGHHDPPYQDRVDSMMLNSLFARPRMGCAVVDTTGHLVGVMGEGRYAGAFPGSDSLLSVTTYANAAAWYGRSAVKEPSKFLGVRVRSVTSRLAAALGLTTTSGALVEFVAPDSPAARAGIQGGTRVVGVGRELSRQWESELLKMTNGQHFAEWRPGVCIVGGDVIVGVDGRLVRSATAFGTILYEHTHAKAHPVVTLRLVRNGKPLKVKAKLVPNLVWGFIWL